MRQQLRQALEQLAAIKDKPAAPAQTEPKAIVQPAGDDDIRAELRNMRDRDRVRDLVGELGLADQKQGKAVLDLLSKNPDLAPPEALELAAKRAPDLFKERATSGYDPRMHGSLRPTHGSQPEPPPPSEHKQRIEYAKKLRASGHGHRAEEIVVDLLGAAAAKAIGWEYKSLPIPKP